MFKIRQLPLCRIRLTCEGSGSRLLQIDDGRFTNPVLGGGGQPTILMCVMCDDCQILRQASEGSDGATQGHGMLRSSGRKVSQPAEVEAVLLGMQEGLTVGWK